MTQLTQSADSAATEKFGERLGHNLRGGEIIELISDLGGGKTTLTRGIARGAGSKNVVGSPTFTLSKVYTAPAFNIYHYDFYRLQAAGLMEYELADIISDPKAVLIIEWGEVVQHVLPARRLTITIRKLSDGSRQLDCSYPEDLSYLLAL
ncbi:MAG TPA: tRNA (adenosine(37)-N6)-threonylcarbamoyltransferase complex ATPase subunit type 1 TsaE [Candidatus Limnocylindrales bacterium]|nr:tRNA (adenosine(37)-N6)-threonylcarbamoyltransferase complex ATPase subunit type 1 TsaE [Candidatus Limnocylindrales bacterium]